MGYFLRRRNFYLRSYVYRRKSCIPLYSCTCSCRQCLRMRAYIHHSPWNIHRHLQKPAAVFGKLSLNEALLKVKVYPHWATLSALPWRAMYATHFVRHSVHEKDQRCHPSMLRSQWWSRLVWTDLNTWLQENSKLVIVIFCQNLHTARINQCLQAASNTLQLHPWSWGWSSEEVNSHVHCSITSNVC